MCLERACQESCCKQYGQVFLAPTRPWLDSSETQLPIGQDMSISYKNLTGQLLITRDDCSGHDFLSLTRPYWTAAGNISVSGEGKFALSKFWLDTVDSSETQALIGQHIHTHVILSIPRPC